MHLPPMPRGRGSVLDWVVQAEMASHARRALSERNNVIVRHRDHAPARAVIPVKPRDIAHEPPSEASRGKVDHIRTALLGRVARLLR